MLGINTEQYIYILESTLEKLMQMIFLKNSILLMLLFIKLHFNVCLHCEFFSLTIHLFTYFFPTYFCSIYKMCDKYLLNVEHVTVRSSQTLP